MKNLIVTLVISFLLFSCNKKNQDVVKILDGSWLLTEQVFIEDGETFTLEPSEEESTTLFFDNCKLRKEDFCNATITTIENEETTIETIKYQVKDDGEILVLQYPSTEFTVNQNFSIEELTASKLVTKTTLNNGITSISTYVKS